MGHEIRKTFVRPQFEALPKGSGNKTSALDTRCASLLDLVRFSAKHNADQIFCLQAEARDSSDAPPGGDRGFSTSEISYKKLYHAVKACAAEVRDWLQPITGRSDDYKQPVALYIESDVGLFIYFTALLKLRVPVLLISVRLSSSNVRHLLQESGSSIIFVSHRTKALLDRELHEVATVFEVDPWRSFMREKPLSATGPVEANTRSDGDSRDMTDDGMSLGSLILHSSGTTGLPKPIYLSQRYLLGYAACHELGQDDVDWRNFSTLPLYHGFGLLSPCLSLSVGMTCCFPPATIIPAARSTIQLLQVLGAKSLMTVPSIVDDILSLPGAEALSATDLLQSLKFVAVGGGSLAIEKSSQLRRNGIKLLNHYGVTEIGAIAPIFCPGLDYDSNYLRLREDLNLELRQIPGSSRYKLVCTPVGWDSEFEVKDEMERNPRSDRMEVRILGRSDDLIVLKSGEKVMPRALETTLMNDPLIRTAVCVGSGHFEIVVLVEPSSVASDDAQAVRRRAWELTSKLNPTLDQHGRVSSEKSIIIKDPRKPFPVSDKGSIMRREVMERFNREIDAAYSELETSSCGSEASLDFGDMMSSVRRLVNAVAGSWLQNSARTLEPQDDFFQRGMDSLEATRLARLLSPAVSKQIPVSGHQRHISAEFIYANPSIRLLSQALERAMHRQGDEADRRDRVLEMRQMVAEFAGDAGLHGAAPPPGYVVLLTGVTGNLGAHVLAQLVRNHLIRKVICLLRQKAQEESPYERVQKALTTAGLSVLAQDWSKIELQQSDPAQWPSDQNNEVLRELTRSVTHILHLAWPMDFHRTLQSFRPQLQELRALINLARAANSLRPSLRVRLVFASSIAIVRNFADIYPKPTNGNGVPEAVFEDPKVTTPMGYAEAKWVCERMMARVACESGTQVDAVVVRIGQLSGPERSEGRWKSSEHIPALVRASQKVGAFPILQGTVSWLPVDRAARSLMEMTLHMGECNGFLHLENPTRQPLTDIATIMAHELGLPETQAIPFERWLQRVADADGFGDLEDFFKNHFQTLADGSVPLDTANSRAISQTLRASGGVGKDLAVRYIKRWQREGFLE
ncbi:L-aminoadipate-semialdehyde dehydrogenase [Tolypocladium paradoxum]|uniref:L-aminoadipate-semialdehyde dehydrogenase n=1 Tax=Tolypocladium paradoxum TaxID=94208 RepID=A0A2S4KYP1_9HYPO|nr:L-aminoadipate-semialdehyde dehydrogenase [Tolypocladium paradoxum]